MTVRERLEQAELSLLSPYAVAAISSKGRMRPKAPCDVRTCFERDCGSIVHSKSFRRLKHKTQVFLSPEGDHYRTRLTHTLEVSQIARTVARALRMNEALTEAIAMGHDLGHPPFGHAGERSLNQLCPHGFAHNEQSLRVVDRVEKNGEGLNLTYEVRDGILTHTGKRSAETLEGLIVHYSDRIAYINHDIDDAIRAGVLREEEIPAAISSELGVTYKQCINALVLDLIECSMDKPYIKMTPATERAMERLRSFLFKAVYTNPIVKGEESKASEMLAMLYEYFEKHPDQLPEDYAYHIEDDGVSRAVCDYIAGMSDRYAVFIYSELFIPKGWNKV